ncbi:MAG: nucleoside-diphosphate-sugar epimerase [Chitinophagaceae bacterium BSSC1]|nr:MAG: nucleoside-diphosphate-sugar epimerase [Chitinophagaceae bacterium BSSC1]
MGKILISGFSGFVGQNLISYLEALNFQTENINLRQPIDIKTNDNIETFVHLAGKAHDLKNVSNENEYFQINFELTKKYFEKFLHSNATTFIFLSSVKAAADSVDAFLTEDHKPQPETAYGRSKLAAENHLITYTKSTNKRIIILRPCMIHGPGNKGNLNLLYSVISKGIPWPLGAFENRRSFCSIENLCFTISEFISNKNLPRGIYNVSDDDTISTNELVSMISNVNNMDVKILKINKKFIFWLAKIGTYFSFPFNSDRLQKLTETYCVSNDKLVKTLNKQLPVSAITGMLKSLRSFNK